MPMRCLAQLLRWALWCFWHGKVRQGLVYRSLSYVCNKIKKDVIPIRADAID